jgi:hypothetical protein
LDLAQIRPFVTKNFQTEFERCLEASQAWSDALPLKKGVGFVSITDVALVDG